MTTTNRYLFFFLLWFITCISIVGLVNVLVNPYHMFEETVSWFSKKPESTTKARIFKKYQAANKGYTTLIIGNSRVEMGLDPNSPAFKGQKVYNMGIQGLSVRAQLNYAKYAMLTNKIRTVLISVDFIDFLSSPTKTFSSQQAFSLQALGEEHTSDYLAAFFSLDAFTSSILTIINQSENAPSRTLQGFNPAKDYINILKHEGQDVLTQQKLNSLEQQIRGNELDSLFLFTHPESPLLALRASIQKWRENNIEVIVFINPYQDLYYKALSNQRLLASFERWRVMMQLFVKEDSATFYDFTELGIQHSNTVDKNGKLAYFWEPAHYKKELGEKMLKSILK